MTTRERWIVYPLVFMSLGIALRDKVIPPSVRAVDLVAPKVRCNLLEVANVRCLGKMECGVLAIAGPKGKERIRMGVASNRAGRLELCGEDGKTVVVLGADGEGKSGIVETLTSEGFPLVQLRATEGGGTVWTIDREKRTALILGHYPKDSGLFVEIPGRRIPLTMPVRRNGKSPNVQPPKGQTPPQPATPKKKALPALPALPGSS